MKPRLQSVPLDELLRRIETDFAPMARAKDIELVIMRTSLAARSDPNLLRRLVQNLVWNAIKYTLRGRCWWACAGTDRRRRSKSSIRHRISNIEIRTVFKEFARLQEGARTASGLASVSPSSTRISRVLNHPVGLQSKPERATGFKVTVPLDKSAGAGSGRNPSQRRKRRSTGGHKRHLHRQRAKILEGMALLLGGWGCSVTTAESLAACTEMAPGTLSVRPDAIVADYHLGDGTVSRRSPRSAASGRRVSPHSW